MAHFSETNGLGNLKLHYRRDLISLYLSLAWAARGCCRRESSCPSRSSTSTCRRGDVTAGAKKRLRVAGATLLALLSRRVLKSPLQFPQAERLARPARGSRQTAALRRYLSCMCAGMAQNWLDVRRIGDGTELARKDPLGMRSLSILILLLIAVIAGGCKTCFLWQLGPDRIAVGAPARCAPPCAAPGDPCCPCTN